MQLHEDFIVGDYVPGCCCGTGTCGICGCGIDDQGSIVKEGGKAGGKEGGIHQECCLSVESPLDLCNNNCTVHVCTEYNVC